jgi:hypothetical protein
LAFISSKREIASAMSKKETWLNYSIQPFSRRSINDISPVQLPATKLFHLLFSQKLYVDLTAYSAFIMPFVKEKVNITL